MDGVSDGGSRGDEALVQRAAQLDHLMPNSTPNSTSTLPNLTKSGKVWYEIGAQVAIKVGAELAYCETP